MFMYLTHIRNCDNLIGIHVIMKNITIFTLENHLTNRDKVNIRINVEIPKLVKNHDHCLITTRE